MKMTKAVYVGCFIINVSMGGVHSQQAPVILLHSSERIFSKVSSVRSVVASRNGGLFYILSAERNTIVFYDTARDIFREVPSFMRSPDAVAVDSQGWMYLADTEANQIAISDPLGQRRGMFHVARPLSLAVLSNRNIVVASPAEGALLHIYDPSGRKLKSFGAIKPFDEANCAQNLFLNKGRVLVDSSDTIYYVFEFALPPTIQKFSKDGELLSEFAIEGPAVDLQVQMARRFLSAKAPSQVGGIVTIAAATIDPTTNRLWMGVNGSSRVGTVYEYSADGKKLREYGFVFKPTGKIVLGMREILVMAPWIYVFEQTGTYRFHMNDRLADGFSALEGQCPLEQEWPACRTNSGTPTSDDDQDCQAALRSLLSATARVIGHSCAVTGSSCSASVTTCDTTNGTQAHHTLALDCRIGEFLN